jgi:predicted MFS family arabinose efflux permease
MHLIPQSWAHVHILVSVFPSFGLVCVLGFYIGGFFTDNSGIKRACLVLFALLALLSIPTYLSGQGSMAALSGIPRLPRTW